MFSELRNNYYCVLLYHSYILEDKIWVVAVLEKKMKKDFSIVCKLGKFSCWEHAFSLRSQAKEQNRMDRIKFWIFQNFHIFQNVINKISIFSIPQIQLSIVSASQIRFSWLTALLEKSEGSFGNVQEGYRGWYIFFSKDVSIQGENWKNEKNRKNAREKGKVRALVVVRGNPFPFFFSYNFRI